MLIVSENWSPGPLTEFFEAPVSSSRCMMFKFIDGIKDE